MIKLFKCLDFLEVGLSGQVDGENNELYLKVQTESDLPREVEKLFRANRLYFTGRGQIP